MKLNLEKSVVKYNKSLYARRKDIVAKETCEDWLTLEAECTKQVTLIEQLETSLIHVLRMFVHIEVESDKKYLDELHNALSAVEAWRKEQG